ncbi:MAG: hypothetical protein RLO52_23105 [Sandaracinaceae bacterium]
MSALDDAIRDDLLVLFDGFEPSRATADPTDERDLISAWTEISSPSWTGTVGVCGSKSSLIATAPLRGIDPLDWAGELANLAAGRLKYGLQVRTRVLATQGVPSVARGSRLPRRASARVMTLRGPAGTLRVWVDLVDRPGSHGAVARDPGLAPGASRFFD